MPINAPTSDTETEVPVNPRLRRDHPVLHPHLRYAEAARVARTQDLLAAHEGYAGLEADDDEIDVDTEILPRRGIDKTARQQREEMEEVLRGWASL